MNLYQLLVPQLLAGAAIVVFALRAVRQSRRDSEAHDERLARRRTDLNRYGAQINEAIAHPGVPASAFVREWTKPALLRVTLGLADPHSLADVGRMARDAEGLLRGLSELETAIGGRGMILTEARAEPGRVVLTLTPKEGTGATARVERVAGALNATFGSPAPTPEAAADFGPLPGDVSSARAVTLAA